MTWVDARVANASGIVSQKFSSVAEAFSENFSEETEIGACFAAIIDGEIVVDIKGGHRERTAQNAWANDTIACVYSTGKAVLSLLVARAVMTAIWITRHRSRRFGRHSKRREKKRLHWVRSCRTRQAFAASRMKCRNRAGWIGWR